MLTMPRPPLPLQAPGQSSETMTPERIAEIKEWFVEQFIVGSTADHLTQECLNEIERLTAENARLATDFRDWKEEAQRLQQRQAHPQPEARPTPSSALTKALEAIASGNWFCFKCGWNGTEDELGAVKCQDTPDSMGEYDLICPKCKCDEQWLSCDASEIAEEVLKNGAPDCQASGMEKIALEQFRKIEVLLKSMMPNHGNPMHKGPGAFCPLCIATESIEALRASPGGEGIEQAEMRALLSKFAYVTKEQAEDGTLKKWCHEAAAIVASHRARKAAELWREHDDPMQKSTITDGHKSPAPEKEGGS